MKDRKRVVAKIQGLASNPRPVGCETLSGAEKYRVRQGSYRILYEIVDDELVITVAPTAHAFSAPFHCRIGHPFPGTNG